ncbi:kelch-like protein 10 [Tachysurus vachellii]|uniref:kelch-like protein 10 n=1 Tax=Tachysurus vachellii TaxID=175792 RepID=UPI00296AA824|nr:kelch-like protein 10 [Tachysurus vachellii]
MNQHSDTRRLVYEYGEREMSKDRKLCGLLNEMRLDGSLCDAVLRVDEVDFKVHKNILSAYSPYFRYLFRRCRNLDQRVYNITGVSPEIMALMIHYMYTQDIQVTTDKVETLLDAANHLLIHDLALSCCEFLKDHLNPDNCVRIWQYADANAYYKLQDQAYMYTLHHFEDVVFSQSGKFLELTVEKLSDILEKDELNIKEEKTAFQAVFLWIRHEPKVQKQQIVNLLPKVSVRNTSWKITLTLTLGLVYVIGGSDIMEYFNSTCTFNPLDGRWNDVAPMHSPRRYVSVTVLDGFIYAIGGFDGTMSLNTAECYQPSTNQWSLIPSMNEQRSDASAATLNGKIYICGGCNGNECHFTVECFDPYSNQWTLIEPMHMPRSGLGVIALNNQLFAIGGFDGVTPMQSIEAFNPRTNSWRILSPMFNPRSNFGIEGMDGRLYVIGGCNDEGTTSRCKYYDVYKDEWFKIQNMNSCHSAVSCCVVSALPNVTDYTTKRDLFL